MLRMSMTRVTPAPAIRASSSSVGSVSLLERYASPGRTVLPSDVRNRACALPDTSRKLRVEVMDPDSMGDPSPMGATSTNSGSGAIVVLGDSGADEPAGSSSAAAAGAAGRTAGRTRSPAQRAEHSPAAMPVRGLAMAAT